MAIIRDLELLAAIIGMMLLYLLGGPAAAVAFALGFLIAALIARAFIAAYNEQMQKQLNARQAENAILQAAVQRAGEVMAGLHQRDRMEDVRLFGFHLNVEWAPQIKGWRLSFTDCRDDQGDPWRVDVDRDGSGRCTCGHEIEQPTEPRLGPTFALLHLANTHSGQKLGFDEAVSLAESLWASVQMIPDPPGDE